ncbi:MAG: ZIP family metal transporter [Eubacteriales bacterium]|nr:ZIP family metal transporter [Eubacteriales bacterium]MDD3882079.1 ZIP family metal transporter [Eubacteriales bacterium]MDD4512526.1 ZIP family metal transporter [Eubacteriales bacterium]
MLSVLLFSLAVSMTGALLAALLCALPVMKSESAVSRVLYLSAGLMLFITCFDLLPEALSKMPVLTLVSTFSGAALIAVGRSVLEKKLSASSKAARASLLILVGLALHNLPEGMAIGAGYVSSISLGLKLAAGIVLHDVPEGLAAALPLITAGKKRGYIFAMLLLSSAPTFLGVIIGGGLSFISESMVSALMGLAGGAMLQLICLELIPQAQKTETDSASALYFPLGMMLAAVTRFI